MVKEYIEQKRHEERMCWDPDYFAKHSAPPLPNHPHEGNTMKLVYKETGKEVKIGDRVKLRSGEEAEVRFFRPPAHAASSGKVSVKAVSGKYEHEFYVSVIGAEWIEREDRAELLEICDEQESSNVDIPPFPNSADKRPSGTIPFMYAGKRYIFGWTCDGHEGEINGYVERPTGGFVPGLSGWYRTDDPEKACRTARQRMLADSIE